VVSPAFSSSCVNGCDFPPDADTRCSAPRQCGANTIVPSARHVPPRPSCVSQMIEGGPPPISIRFSFPSAKYAIDRLSGDQNGKSNGSVISFRASSESIGRIHSAGS
jgi:hypothetical protein